MFAKVKRTRRSDWRERVPIAKATPVAIVSTTAICAYREAVGINAFASSGMTTGITTSATAASGVSGRVSAIVVAPYERAISMAPITARERPLFETAKATSFGRKVDADMRC